MWKLEDAKIDYAAPGVSDYSAIIKVGVSPADEALRAFKDISAIVDTLSYEARPRVIKALNEIYREDGR